jgi:hypothetical protein
MDGPNAAAEKKRASLEARCLTALCLAAIGAMLKVAGAKKETNGNEPEHA